MLRLRHRSVRMTTAHNKVQTHYVRVLVLAQSNPCDMATTPMSSSTSRILSARPSLRAQMPSESAGFSRIRVQSWPMTYPRDRNRHPSVARDALGEHVSLRVGSGCTSASPFPQNGAFHAGSFTRSMSFVRGLSFFHGAPVVSSLGRSFLSRPSSIALFLLQRPHYLRRNHRDGLAAILFLRAARVWSALSVEDACIL